MILTPEALIKRKYATQQSGATAFFGIPELEEYKYQKFHKKIPGYDFGDTIFVSKTSKLAETPGNTALEKENGYKMKDMFPSSIWFSPKSFILGYMLNAVGLSGPGLEALLKSGYWQQRTEEYFQISIQLDGKTWEDVEPEIKKICELFNHYLPPTKYHYDLQVNKSCPNAGYDTAIDYNEVELTKKELLLFKKLMPNTKIWLKYNALIKTEVLSALKQYCAGFVISNTIPFGAKCDIKWNRLFKGGKSPLPKRLGKPDIPKFRGGLSGSPARKVLMKNLADHQSADPELTIIAGIGLGFGLRWRKHIRDLSKFTIVKKATYGIVGPLRPLRVRKLARYINKTFRKRDMQLLKEGKLQLPMVA